MKQLTIFIGLSLLLFTTQCSKDNAGYGGKAQINVKVIYGNQNMPNTDVKVMYNARTFPGSSASYNNSIIADEKGDAVFKNLRRGDYYFYGSIMINDSLYEGGVYSRIASKKGETHVVIDFGVEDPFNSTTPPLENP